MNIENTIGYYLKNVFEKDYGFRTLQTNPRHHVLETQNTNSHMSLKKTDKV